MSTHAINPIAEMGRFIRGSISLARTKRAFAELLGWEAAEDIQADVEAHVSAARDVVYGEEQRNRINAATIADVLADGRVTPEELPRLRNIARGELAGAEKLHDATEALTP